MKQIFVLLFFLLSFGANAQFHATGKDLPCINKEFKILAHIGQTIDGDPGITEEEVIASVEAVNEFFAPICVSFSVCEIEYMDNYNFNFPREHLFEEMHALFGEAHVIDVYFCIINIGGSRVCGVTEGNILDLNEGAIYLHKNCPEVLVHELGHLFGLLDTHTFGPNNTFVDNSNCETTGDFICDTPADPFDGSPLFVFLSGCDFVFPGVDPNGDYYLTEVGNIMSAYVPCYCGFSREQYLKMLETYNDSPHRFW